MVTIKMENTNPTEVYDKAISEYDKGNTLEAENLFLKVLEIEPSHAGAMLKLQNTIHQPTRQNLQYIMNSFDAPTKGLFSMESLVGHMQSWVIFLRPGHI